MKNLYLTLCIHLLFINFCFSQYKYPLIEDVEIDLKNYGTGENLLGAPKFKCSKNDNQPDEAYYPIFIYAKFKDFSTRKTFDFNNLSIVDVENKVRYRPISVTRDGFQLGNTAWYANQIEFNDNKDDAFIKYSQDGIENFDFYVYSRNGIGVKNERKYRYRLEPENFKGKNGIHFTFDFPLFKKRNDSGHYKIYWKNKLIGEFKIKDGKNVK